MFAFIGRQLDHAWAWLRGLIGYQHKDTPTSQDLILEWLTFEQRATFAERRNVQDPRLIAGQYLDWAGDDIERAIQTLMTHSGGKYTDMPPFPGCVEALDLLKQVRDNEPQGGYR